MFLKKWNFFAGFVKVEISGFSVERFISQAVAKGIILWNLQRCGGKFLATMSTKDFWKCQSLAEKTSTNVNPKSFHGMPVFWEKIKKRPLLPIGALIFVIGMILITSFIWQIDIEGTDRIDNTEIISFLERQGFSVGNPRRGVAYRQIESMLMLEFEDIAWVSLSITGTRALIRITETIYHQPLASPYDAQDIVASKDGIIVYMATSAGTPLFRPGDVVAAGETIVSGQLNIETAEEGLIATQYIQALAEIWARVYYTMEFNIPLTYTEKNFTGRSQRIYNITIGNQSFHIPHSAHNFVYYEVIENHRQINIGQDFPLPLAATVTTYYELMPNIRSRSPELAKELAEEFMSRRIVEELGDDPDIIQKQTNFTQSERELVVEVFLTVIERIDQTQELVPEEFLEVPEEPAQEIP